MTKRSVRSSERVARRRIGRIDRLRAGSTWRSQRGAALAVVVGTALIASLGAYAILTIAISQARQSQALRSRAASRYLAEAGIVVATQRLYTNPAYCPGAPVRIDTNGNGANASDPSVTITVSNCGAGNRHIISAKASY